MYMFVVSSFTYPRHTSLGAGSKIFAVEFRRSGRIFTRAEEVPSRTGLAGFEEFSA